MKGISGCCFKSHQVFCKHTKKSFDCHYKKILTESKKNPFNGLDSDECFLQTFMCLRCGLYPTDAGFTQNAEDSLFISLARGKYAAHPLPRR